MSTSARTPKMLSAILSTIAALCGLLSSLLIVSRFGNYSEGFVILQLFITGLLIAYAILQWAAYTKRYVNYRIGQAIGPQDKDL